MIKIKSKKPHRYDIWVSEIRLKKISAIKRGKINKLLRLLREDFNEEIS